MERGLSRQKKQLSEEWLTKARALHIAHGSKVADHRTSEMKVAAKVRIFQGDQACYHCGKSHDSKVCKFKDTKCFDGGKMGILQQCACLRSHFKEQGSPLSLEGVTIPV